MIEVSTIRRTGRKHIEARWIDPVTGLKKTRTTGTSNQREADRFAGQLQAELNSGKQNEATRMTWDEFQERADGEFLAGQKPKSREKMLTMFRSVKKHIKPARLASLDAATISQYTKKLRENGLAEATVKGYLACLRSALTWAQSIDLIPYVPKIKGPKKVRGMKGRAIAREEFERILAKVPLERGTVLEMESEWSIAMNVDPVQLTEAMEGLWWSGLRLSEALALHWTDDSELQVDMDSEEFPMFRIRGDAEKGGKDRLLPIAPEFVKQLEQVPPKKRKGFVFFQGTSPRPRMDTISKVISAVGELAGVRVSPKKFASAHDFRRSFGFRWSRLIFPADLQELMRHEVITTTMEFYVGRNASIAAAKLWEVFGNKMGNSPEKSSKSAGECSD